MIGERADVVHDDVRRGREPGDRLHVEVGLGVVTGAAAVDGGVGQGAGARHPCSGEIGAEVAGVRRGVDDDGRGVTRAAAAMLHREVERLRDACGQRSAGVAQRAVERSRAVAAAAGSRRRGGNRGRRGRAGGRGRGHRRRGRLRSGRRCRRRAARQRDVVDVLQIVVAHRAVTVDAEVHVHRLARVRAQVVALQRPGLRVADRRVEVVDHEPVGVEQIGFLIGERRARLVGRLPHVERERPARRDGDSLADARVAVRLRRRAAAPLRVRAGVRFRRRDVRAHVAALRPVREPARLEAGVGDHVGRVRADLLRLARVDGVHRGLHRAAPGGGIVGRRRRLVDFRADDDQVVERHGEHARRDLRRHGRRFEVGEAVAVLPLPHRVHLGREVALDRRARGGRVDDRAVREALRDREAGLLQALDHRRFLLHRRRVLAVELLRREEMPVRRRVRIADVRDELVELRLIVVTQGDRDVDGSARRAPAAVGVGERAERLRNGEQW